DTYPSVSERWGHALDIFDSAVITVFVFEVGLKLIAYRLHFFRDGWRLFDLFVVTVSLIPNAGPFTVLRALRVLRLFRVMSLSDQMRRAVEALFRAMPAMAGIVALLAVIFYVFAVMATRLFREADPVAFATLDETALTLFQVMTLEGWAEVMAPVREMYPWSWIFFLLFIVLSSFAVLNLFIAVIVDALQSETFNQEEERDQLQRADAERHHQELLGALAELRDKVDRLERRAGLTPAGAPARLIAARKPALLAASLARSRHAPHPGR
ncbi:MAG: ion transporter, partial [Caulobacterales bacterium]|nr:ion transporter [Caulobacterales bacterium]